MARILCQFYNPATRIPVFHRSRQTGVSLIELLVVCLTIGILVQLAIPSFQVLSDRTKRNATTRLLITDLNWARTEALANSTRLYLCPGQNSDRCRSNTDWSQGWSVFSDQNYNGQLEPSELLLVRTLVLNNSIFVRFRKPGYLFYKNDGSAWPNGTFKICTAGSKLIRSWILFSKQDYDKGSGSVSKPQFPGFFSSINATVYISQTKTSTKISCQSLDLVERKQ